MQHVLPGVATSIIPKLSTVARGTRFEERSLKMLKTHLSMSVKRVGGKDDGGIDLVGWWWLPLGAKTLALKSGKMRKGKEKQTEEYEDDHADSFLGRQRFRIIGQCKAEKKKMGPNYVRELEGVYLKSLLGGGGDLCVSPGSSSSLGTGRGGPDVKRRGRPRKEPVVVAGHDGMGTLWDKEGKGASLAAVLISESEFTPRTMVQAMSSRVPMMLLCLPSPREEGSEEDSRVEKARSAIMNPALAGPRGLLRGLMEVRWEWNISDSEEGRVEGWPSLWWRGKRLRNWVPPS